LIQNSAPPQPQQVFLRRPHQTVVNAGQKTSVPVRKLSQSPVDALAQVAEPPRVMGATLCRAFRVPQFVFELPTKRYGSGCCQEPARSQCLVLDRTGMATALNRKRRPGESRKFSTTLVSKRPPSGAQTRLVSLRSRPVDGVMQRKSPLAPRAGMAGSVPSRRNTWHPGGFTDYSNAAPAQAQADRQRQRHLTGSPYPRNGSRGDEVDKADLGTPGGGQPARFVKLPTPVGLELDTSAVQSTHERWRTWAVDGLVAVPQKVGLENVAHLGERSWGGFGRFPGRPKPCAAHPRFQGCSCGGPARHGAGELRPYQKDGFDFWRTWSRSGLGAFWRMTWAWAKRSRHSRGWRGSRSAIQEPQALARHLSGVVCTIGGASPNVYARAGGAGAGKRRGAAQPAQTDSAARSDRDQLRAAPARSGGAAEILLPRRDSRRGTIHQESRRAGHAWSSN